ncbi:hypothetical protein JZ751_028734 [Albula glossodonta]|uniref:Uncharacterized protein n=1 Tax=Albula glossodonta TaxID=121402 RepID=A0A8T2NAH0_9TELE|nr:hypothetical protein JZ751_028734 [Albula glossodonta]
MGNTTSCCVSSSPKLRRNAHSRLEPYRPEPELSREDTGCNLQHISDRENIDVLTPGSPSDLEAWLQGRRPGSKHSPQHKHFIVPPLAAWCSRPFEELSVTNPGLGSSLSWHLGGGMADTSLAGQQSQSGISLTQSACSEAAHHSRSAALEDEKREAKHHLTTATSLCLTQFVAERGKENEPDRLDGGLLPVTGWSQLRQTEPDHVLNHPGELTLAFIKRCRKVEMKDPAPVHSGQSAAC